MISIRSLVLFVISTLLLVVGAVQLLFASGATTDIETDDLLKRYVIKQSNTPIADEKSWSRPKRVAILVPAYLVSSRPDYKTWFQQAAGDAELVFASNGSELIEAARDADVVLGSCAVLRDRLPKLRWMQRYGVGVEGCIDGLTTQDQDVLLTNTAGLSGPFIAEHVITMTMMLSHGAHQYYEKKLAGEWARSFGFPTSVEPVAGKTMLVVGLGGIGTKVAEKAAALGIQVNAIRNSRRAGPEFVNYVGLSHELTELAAKADFVVNTLPLTDTTTGIYDAKFFDAMKSSAYFINVGRGKSVITDDLVAALETGQIAGAGLDVFDPEPLPAGHPLWKLPNVLITPHVSARSSFGSADTMLFVRENLRRYTAGEAMLNVVNQSSGY